MYFHFIKHDRVESGDWYLICIVSHCSIDSRIIRYEQYHILVILAWQKWQNKSLLGIGIPHAALILIKWQELKVKNLYDPNSKEFAFEIMFPNASCMYLNLQIYYA